MLTRKKRRVLFWISIVIFLILLVPVLFYSLGYTLGPDWTIKKTGGIFIQASESGANVYVDGKNIKGTSFFSANALIKNLSPGVHKVKVSKEGFSDWEKTLSVDSETVTNRTGLLIHKDPVGRFMDKTEITALPPSGQFILKKKIVYAAVPAGSLEKQEALYFGVKKFWELPDTTDLIILGDDGNFYKNKNQFNVIGNWGTTTADILKSDKNSFFTDASSRLIYWDRWSIDSYWIDNLDRMPQWEQNIEAKNLRLLHIYSADEEIRGVMPYPNYPDYLLVVLANGVYVLEMDPSGGQNIFTLYKGKAPNIISATSKLLILLDDGRYIEIKLP